MASRTAAVMALAWAGAAAAATYQNPIVTEAKVDLGDPGALYHDGYYYLATSSGPSADAYPIHRSADLVNWEEVGHVFPQWQAKKNPAWATTDFWAPDLQKVNATHFAVYFSAHNAQRESLGVAFATNVTGPYVDIGAPLWSDPTNPQGTIDVHYHASNGQKYLVWKANQNPIWASAQLMMQKLRDDGAALVGQPWVLAKADQKWETWGCVEAPWLVERNGTWYLFYSGSMVNFPLETYAVGVARATSIEGPYTKHPGPILHRCGYNPPVLAGGEEERAAAEAPASVIGFGTGYVPGHCSVLPVEGEDDKWVMFYHGRGYTLPGGGPRVLMMDELRWGADGWPYIANACPSTTAQAAP
eukprot:TRINITY_DN2011_c0_g1_i3.p1 TRINITY_DN2011_c0_g1~~TRINITY_DN2011_c0_g1_i3.p1  ORF type:complete len:358 (+),score=125.90 TRINITY_DN2011_c0_g1_i3:95-1168(+)